MAKRTSNSSVNSSIRKNTAVTGEGFTQLLDLQKLSNEHLESIRSVLSQSLNAQRLQALEDAIITKEAVKEEEGIEDVNKTLAESLEVQKELLRKQTEAAVAVASTIKTFRTFADGWQDFKQNIRQNFSSVSKALLSSRIVKSGSMMDKLLGVSKRAARDEFVDRQRALGSTKSKSEIQKDFKEVSRINKDIKKNDNEIEIFKRKTGLNEEQMAKTETGKNLLDRRADLGQKVSQHDLAAQIAKDSIKDTRNTTVSKEDQQEAIKRQDQQTEVLKEIAKNTQAQHNALKPKAEGGEGGDGDFGGGFLGGLAKVLEVLGSGLGKGLGALITGVSRGLMSLAPALVALTPAIPVILAIGAASVGFGAALRLATPAIEAFAPVLMKVADVIQNVFIKGIETMPAIIEKIGGVIMGVIDRISSGIVNVINEVTSSIERLSKIDGSALVQVGAGLLAVSGGMAAFAGANVVSGLSNMATGLLSKISGQKSPVEQLEQIAKLGPGLEQAGIGIEKLSSGLRGFSSVDGTTVSNMSNQVSAMKDKAAISSTTVVAPSVSNNMKQTQIAKIEAPVRSSDSSLDRYLSTRTVY